MQHNRIIRRNITSFYGPSCANNGKDALNTPEYNTSYNTRVFIPPNVSANLGLPVAQGLASYQDQAGKSTRERDHLAGLAPKVQELQAQVMELHERLAAANVEASGLRAEVARLEAAADKAAARADMQVRNLLKPPTNPLRTASSKH
eukprot:2088777-Pyramimonas_sp.AAC.1